MLRALWRNFVEDLIRGIGGPLGVRLRRAWYRGRLRACGERLVIEPGAWLLAPEWISLGDDVWIDRQAILIGGPPGSNVQVSRSTSDEGAAEPGEIQIGARAHVGIGAIIQGHGGVWIGDAFTASPHAKIYSLSNDHRKCRGGTHPAAGADGWYVMTPVVIGDNVWLGINGVVVGHRIGSDSFIKPGAVVSGSIPPNSVAEGAPARRSGARFAEAEIAPRRPRRAAKTSKSAEPAGG